MCVCMVYIAVDNVQFRYILEIYMMRYHEPQCRISHCLQRILLCVIVCMMDMYSITFSR